MHAFAGVSALRRERARWNLDEVEHAARRRAIAHCVVVVALH